MWIRLLNLALIVVPWVIELINRRRAEGEKASTYVKKVQAEKLETTKLLLEQNGEKLSRLSRGRLALTRERLARLRQGHKPTP